MRDVLFAAFVVLYTVSLPHAVIFTKAYLWQRKTAKLVYTDYERYILRMALPPWYVRYTAWVLRRPLPPPSEWVLDRPVGDPPR